MAGRHRLPHHSAHPQRQPPPHAIARGPLPPPSLRALEERLAVQGRDLNKLVTDNQHLAATHVALKRDLVTSRQDLRLLADTAARARAEGDAEVRQLYARSLRAEEEARQVEGMRAEVVALRSEVARMTKERDELAVKAEKLRTEVQKVRGEMGKVEETKWEIEAMKNEIARGRAAIDYEKKAHAGNFQQSRMMEKDMIGMAREVEKLRAELANAEKRARAAAAASAAAKPGSAYAESYGNRDLAYGGSAPGSAYGFHQAQRGADGGFQYGPGAVPHGAYDIQQQHGHR